MNDPQPNTSRPPASRRAAVTGLLVVLGLIVVGLILVKILGDAGRMQDCAMSGRTNCAPIDPGSAPQP